MHILVAGGTGTAGRVLVQRLSLAGHQVRVLARRSSADVHGHEVATGDLMSGSGLDEAMSTMDAVVDASNLPSPFRRKASAFFTAGTDHLFDAEQRAGVRHHVTLSIVGIDQIPSGYYRAKLDQEAAVVRASERTHVGHTIARVTQFHDFAALVYRQYRVGRLVLAPPLHAQPVHLRDVADHLLGLLTEGPTGRAPDLSGPQPEEVPDMVRRYASAIRQPVRVVSAPLFGTTRRANNAHVLRPPSSRHGTLTFDDWLQELRP